MALRVKINANGSSCVFRVDPAATLGAWEEQICSRALGLSAPVVLTVRMTGRTIVDTGTDRSMSLAEVGIESGSQFDAVGAPGGRAAAASAGAASSGGMRRVVVPADNSCLFTALGYLTLGHSKELGADLREMAVREVLRSDLPDEVFEGKTKAQYAEWLRSKDHWGGAIEMMLLAPAIGVGITAVQVQTGTVYTYGESLPTRVFVLFDGIHYDAAALDKEGGGDETTFQTTFEASDEGALAAVLAVAEEMKRARKFVDTSKFSLLCTVCNTGIVGQKEAVEHASRTGHTNFVEYTPT
jgi:ubiquitin thioesterase OTU1